MGSMLLYLVDPVSTPDPRLVVGEIALVYVSEEVYGCSVGIGIPRINHLVWNTRKWAVDVGF